MNKIKLIELIADDNLHLLRTKETKFKYDLKRFKYKMLLKLINLLTK